MNILIDVRPLMGGKHSGVEIYIRKLLEHLFRIDRANRYVLFANASSDQSDNIPAFGLPNVSSVQTRIPNKLLNMTLFLSGRPRLNKLVARRLPDFKPDVYFLPDLRPFSVSRGIKKVCVVHDLSFVHFPHYFSARTRLWHKLVDARRTLRRFDRLIAVSEATKNDLSRTFGIGPKEVTVIHEGIDRDFCSIADDNTAALVRARYAIPKDYFLFLSTLEPRKNLRRIIEAFKIYKEKHQDDLKLVLVGTANPRIFPKTHIVPHRDVVFTGFVREEDKPHLFRMARAFLYPSIFEGFGLPLLEAMKCGTPIITSESSSMPEICGDAALYVNPADTAQIAEAMDQVQSPPVREKLISNMKSRVGRFSWEKCARETLALFESI